MNQQLHNYIESVFQRFDRDRSGSLDAYELGNFLTEYYRLVGDPTEVTPMAAQWYLEAIDLDCDGRINRRELAEAFRFLAPADLEAVIESSLGHGSPPTSAIRNPQSSNLRNDNMRKARYPGSNATEPPPVRMESQLPRNAFRPTESIILRPPQEEFSSYSSSFFPPKY